MALELVSKVVFCHRMPKMIGQRPEVISCMSKEWSLDMDILIVTTIILRNNKINWKNDLFNHETIKFS